MTLHDDLTRTVALLGDGYRIDTIARGKRAQERTEMLTSKATDTTCTIRQRCTVCGLGFFDRITLAMHELAECHFGHLANKLDDKIGGCMKARVASIVEDAAELVETVGPGDAYVSIAVHSDDLLAAALDLPDAERHDYTNADGRPQVSCRLGRVTFFAAVRL